MKESEKILTFLKTWHPELLHGITNEDFNEIVKKLNIDGEDDSKPTFIEKLDKEICKDMYNTHKIEDDADLEYVEKRINATQSLRKDLLAAEIENGIER